MIKLDEHLVLTQAGENKFFLHDSLRGYNVVMGAASEREAYIEALNRYSKALDRALKDRVMLQKTLDQLKDILFQDDDNH